jgi:CRISPR-associated protein Cmr6
VRQSVINLADRRTSAHHPGLLLQRYLIPPADQSDKEKQKERRSLLTAAIEATRSEELCALYQDAFSRWTDSFPRAGLYLSEQLTLTSRLIIGLGSENVLETGLRLHHTYGVPIIPGSALKGLASHYCHDVWGQRQRESPAQENLRFRRNGNGSYHEFLFGTTADGGVITFHDALITPQSLHEGALRLDVMTPHHPQWQTNQAPPSDFDSPNPVSFLSVAGTFAVRLSWCGPAEATQDQARKWVTLAMTLLREALAEWGIGGKTSSGYGRLVPPETLRAVQPAEVAGRTRRVQRPTTGETVDGKLLEERTKKGGWKARHELSGLSGPIQNTGDVPGERQAGDTVTLIVASVSERAIDFRYPTPADEQRAQRSRNKPQGGGSGRPVRTRR